jgi:hypothetical protein
MVNQKCMRSYHRYGTTEFDTFVNRDINGIYSNLPQFQAPPVTQQNALALQAAYNAAAADYVTYGATKKVALQQAKAIIVDTVNLLADYTDSVANGNESLIILAGFVPSVSVATKNIPLLKVVFFTTKHTAVSGEVVVDIPAITDRGDVFYTAICSEDAPLANPVMVNDQLKVESTDAAVRTVGNKSRKKIFTGLTPGIIYHFYMYATNTVSVAPLIDGKAFMAI